MEITGFASPLKYVFLFIALVLVQVLVCNNILLFGVAVPFVFIFFIITLPMNVSLNMLMCVSFLMGFTVDLFSDTMGLNSLACLILSVVKKPVFYAYLSKDDKFLTAVPSIATVGWAEYLKFIMTLSAVYCILIFGIELFSFASLWRILLMASTSALFTLILVVALDALINSKD